MKSLRIAAYISIVLHFLRKTRRKLSPVPAMTVFRPSGKFNPVIVTLLVPGYFSSVKVAACRNLDLAKRMADAMRKAGLQGSARAPKPTEMTAQTISLILSNDIAYFLDNIFSLESGKKIQDEPGEPNVPAVRSIYPKILSAGCEAKFSTIRLTPSLHLSPQGEILP